MRLVVTVSYFEDLQLEPDVGVVVLPSGQSIRSIIHLFWAVNDDKEDVCMLTHGLKVLSDAAHAHKAFAQVIDIRSRVLTRTTVSWKCLRPALSVSLAPESPRASPPMPSFNSSQKPHAICQSLPRWPNGLDRPP